MLISQIITKLNELYPPQLQEKYDNTGLQVGNPHQPFTAALITTDITENTVAEAIARRANLIISHHPLIFNGIKRLTPDNYIARTIIKAIQHNIVLFSIHTNADKAIGGVSYKMAQKIGLTNTTTLIPETPDGAGLGCIGQLPQPETETHFINRIKQIFGTHTVRHSPLLSRPIATVAMCGGSGAEFIPQAIQRHADIYLTADIKYHNYFQAENQIIIADIGHFESEHLIKEVFCEQLIDFFPNFAFNMAETDTNPVQYT